MKTVRIGVVGAGQIAYTNCPDMSSHPAAELVAVADPSLKRARALKKQFGFKRVYDSAAALLADQDIDAVCVAVPNALHAPIAREALSAGKHVFLDKPFALNLVEARSAVQAARKARKVLMVGMNHRFAEDSQTIKALVERGTLGEIYHVRAYLLRRSGIPKFGTWFLQEKSAGGGVALDLGVHVLDLCLYLMDNFRPTAVSAATYAKFGPRGLGEGGWGMSDKGPRKFDVEDLATAFVRMRGGATIQFEVAWAAHQEQALRSDVELLGTKAGASLRPARIYRFGSRKGEYEVVTPQGLRGPFSETTRLRNWIDVILGHAEPCCTVAQALAVQGLLDGIYLSARSGREVRL